MFEGERVSHAFIVTCHPVAMPPHVAFDALQLSAEAYLGVEFVIIVVAGVGCVHGAFDFLSYIEVGVKDMVVPPSGERATWRGFEVELPIELGHKVVHPSFLVP